MRRLFYDEHDHLHVGGIALAWGLGMLAGLYLILLLDWVSMELLP